VLELFQDWTKSNGLHPGNYILTTFGSWDVKRAIPNACAATDRQIPAILDIAITKHANLKKICQLKTRILPASIPHLMNTIGLKFKGKEHSGLTDTQNLVEAIRAANWIITPTN